MTGKQKEYFSSRETAELLGVAVSTIQQWTNSGLLRAWTTNGGHRRIARSSVEDMISQQQQATGEKSSEQPLSVVIVEDNAQQIRMYESQFLAWEIDANFETANDGYEGLVKIGRIQPDVIITDLIMPKMDGFQMVRALKQIPELDQSSIIAITGLMEDEVEEKGGLPDGVYLFTKPVSFDKLKAILLTKANSLVA